MSNIISTAITALTTVINRSNTKLVATGGTRIIDTTAAFTDFEANSIMAMTDTVISVCSGINTASPGTVVSFTAAPYNWVTLRAGIPIIAPDGFKIKNITLTSGSIAVYS